MMPQSTRIKGPFAAPSRAGEQQNSVRDVLTNQRKPAPALQQFQFIVIESRPHQRIQKNRTLRRSIKGHAELVSAAIAGTKPEQFLVAQSQHSVAAGDKLSQSGVKVIGGLRQQPLRVFYDPNKAGRITETELELLCHCTAARTRSFQ